MGSRKNKTKGDVLIIGGGLGGLTAAIYLARGGLTVTVLEGSHKVGGRAQTAQKKGFAFNLGPHGLYCEGAGIKILKELGISIKGGIPKILGGYAVDQERLYRLPDQLISLFPTTIEKREAVQFFNKIHHLATDSLQGVSVQNWLGGEIQHDSLRNLIQALFRLTTFVPDLEKQSAGAALAQLQLAIRGNVFYLDEGWQSLVNSLKRTAQKSGAILQTGAEVVTIKKESSHYVIETKSGEIFRSLCIVFATSPSNISPLLQHLGKSPTLKMMKEIIPVKAACLDLALSRAPNKDICSAFSIHQPLYFAIHSLAAKLTPGKGALIHVTKYLNPLEAQDAPEDEREMEDFLDLLQPGWRKFLLEKRYLPSLTVAHAMVTAQKGGIQGRHSPAVEGFPNIFLVGDWVGPEGMLSDATLASAKRASEMIIKKF